MAYHGYGIHRAALPQPEVFRICLCWAVKISRIFSRISNFPIDFLGKMRYYSSVRASGQILGIAGGDGCGLIFKKGEILRKVDEKDLLDELMKEIDKL